MRIGSLPLDVDQIVDFVYNAILSDNITARDAGILNLWPTIAAHA